MASYLASMFTVRGGLANRELLFYLQNYGWVLAVSIIVSLPVFPALKRKLENAESRTRAVLSAGYAVLVAAAFLAAVSYMVADTYNPFLYFRF